MLTLLPGQDKSDPAIGCIAPKTVALTYDDGPDDVITAQVMAAALAQNPKIPLIFFEVGSNISARPPVSVSVNNNGFLIGDHTWDHPSAIGLSDALVTQEATTAAAEIKTVTGRNPRFLRPPYGDYTAAAMKDWYNLGMYVVTWDIDSNDWMDPGNADAAYNNVEAAFLEDTHSGHIILCHDVHTACKDALPRIVTLFQSYGYRFVSLDECLNIAPYK